MEKTFRTTFDVKSFPFGLNYSTPTLFLGSCFTENIGKIMQTLKFPILINPFGVLYNPVSVERVLARIIDGKPYSKSELISHNNLWLSFDYHTTFSDESSDKCLENINNSLDLSKEFWNRTQYLIVTFGTARVYTYNKTGLPVTNCHKIPAKEFTHQLLSVDTIVGLWEQLLKRILQQNPELKIVFTVSPVRHWKDGAVGNQLSKSTLLLAVNQLADIFSGKVFYFPSYEIMMDDLRDYRFYADDMLHPSTQAIAYIWETFLKSMITKDAQQLSSQIQSVNQALNHRPFNTKTEEFKKFVQTNLKRIDELCNRYPQLDFSQEVSTLRSKLG